MIFFNFQGNIETKFDDPEFKSRNVELRRRLDLWVYFTQFHLYNLKIFPKLCQCVALCFHPNHSFPSPWPRFGFDSGKYGRRIQRTWTWIRQRNSRKYQSRFSGKFNFDKKNILKLLNYSFIPIHFFADCNSSEHWANCSFRIWLCRFEQSNEDYGNSQSKYPKIGRWTFPQSLQGNCGHRIQKSRPSIRFVDW